MGDGKDDADSVSARMERVELQLKELELENARRSARRGIRINWTISAPLLVAVIAGSFAYVGAWLNTRTQLEVEALKAKNELVIEAIKTGIDNSEKAKQNLTFFLEAGLLTDTGDQIAGALAKLGAPTLPAADAASAFGCDFDIAPMTIEEILAKYEEQPVSSADIEKFRAGVSALVTVPLTQHQLDALVSLAYSIGLGNLGKSTLISLVNAGDFAGAAKQFERWSVLGGNVYRGLVIRRECEREYFLAPDVVG